MNNVGIFEPKPFAEIPDADWFRFFEIDVMSGVRLTRHYLAGMLEKNWGRILSISSESAVQIPAEMLHYGMTKTAQIAIARGVGCRNRCDGKQNPGRTNGIRGRGWLCRCNGETVEQIETRGRERVLRIRAAFVPAEALCHRG